MDQRDCRLSARSDECAKTFFQFADFGRQFQRCRRAIKTVCIADFKLVPAIACLGRMFKYYCRSAIDRRCQRAKAFRHGCVRMDQFGFPVFLVGHAGDCKAKRLRVTVSKDAVAENATLEMLRYARDLPTIVFTIEFVGKQVKLGLQCVQVFDWPRLPRLQLHSLDFSIQAD